MPDYSFKAKGQEATADAEETEAAWPAVDAGTSFSGLVGDAMTLLLAGMTGFGIYAIKKRNKAGAA